ncbi:MAG: amidohydrolase family protein [Erythrobacter sp.]
MSGCAHGPPEPADLRLDGGLWYQDGAFIERTAYVRGGVLSFAQPDLAARRIEDLGGGHVVPPFCEAHNHNIGGSAEGVETVAKAYLDYGVFYALMPGSFALYRGQIERSLNTPTSPDVAFANNGLTGVGGHPRGLRESLMERFDLYPEFTPATLPDAGYFEAANRGEMLAKWELIKAEQPDMLKVMLYFSDEYEARREDPEYYGERGLDPALLPEIVALAHAEGMPAVVHVESEQDMVTALRAGADIIAHLPSYDAPIVLSDETIAIAAQYSAAALVTTFSLAKRVEERDPDRYAAIVAAQASNLARLAEAGAKLVVGSDNTRDVSVGEVAHLRSLNALDNRQLLEMWTANCAVTVFPERKIGRLAHGYEASFLVLDGNPLDDFDATGRIVQRVKQGEVLGAPQR